MIDTGQLLERYRHLSRDIQNGLQTAQRQLEKIKSGDESQKIQNVYETLSEISDAWQDFSGWVLISTLENLEEARNNCAPGRVDLKSKIIRSKKKFKGDIERKGLKIDTSAMQSFVIETYIPYFEQALDLIFGNAVKYSQKAGTVEISIDHTKRGYKISLRSIGPIVHKHELIQLGDTGFGSENARKLPVTGQGYGLYNAKRLVKLLDADLEFRPEQRVLYESSGVAYANFLVELHVPDSPTQRSSTQNQNNLGQNTVFAEAS
jgi:signal transduction histidine kinase